MTGGAANIIGRKLSATCGPQEEREMETVEGTRLHYGDFIVIVAYFAFVLFIGLWVCIKIFFFLFKNFQCT